MQKLYPLKFKKVFKAKVWGGQNFSKLNIDLPSEENYGESWEVSTHPHGISIVENGCLKGKTLQEILELYKEKLVGEKNYKKFEKKFPLLIKYLDINDKLSVQVHPDNEYALNKENEFGKAECWYVIYASEDAKLIYGVNPKFSKNEIINNIRNKNFEKTFNLEKVETGDFIYVAPGIIHGSYTGSILIAEIQQNSDVTYRLYDYDRLVNGEKRKLDIEKAIDVINYDADLKVMKTSPSLESEILISNEYFSIQKLNIKKHYKETADNFFKILSIIDGSENFLSYHNKKIIINKGETYLVPANLEFEIIGNATILKSYVLY